MKETIKLAFRLFLITAASAIILAFANRTTHPLIVKKQQEDYMKSLKVAYKGADTFKPIEAAKLAELKKLNENFEDAQIALKDNKPVGYVFKTIGSGGYSGNVTFVVGITNEGKIEGYSVLQSQETAGIGTRIQEPEFINSVVGKSAEKKLEAVKQPSGENQIQALSGATYSTNAAKNGLNIAIDSYNKIKVK